ncbi:Ribosome bioproteinsis protein brx1 [Puccinia graminis f. sp. tritici]|nr:Ribosome bioproteinsis protein brx1 [Puccinia graminis f. sp. tritici]KAA1109587.1 Ribosome bioproteinsis protein brx1 [Puccinia graminis f. sp. tritici]
MDEVERTGNCLKGSRPIITFGKEFEDEVHWKVCKEVLTNVFAAPKTAWKAKRFIWSLVEASSSLDGDGSLR